MSGKTVLFIHNETSTGWNLEDTSDDRTKLISKPTVIKTKAERVERKVTIGVQRDIIIQDVLDKMLAAPTSKIIKNNYFGDNINVKFSKKTFNPYIKTTTDTNVSHIVLLISLNLNGRKFVRSVNSKSHILEYGFNTTLGELNLIASLSRNKESSSLIITLYDHKKKRCIDYKYTIVNDRVKVTTSEYVDSTIDIKRRTPIMKSYRPKHPTNTIMCHKDDIEEFTDFLEANYPKSSFVIGTFESDTFADLINNLSSTGYRAVTVFEGSTLIKTPIDKAILKIFKTKYLIDTNNNLKNIV